MPKTFIFNKLVRDKIPHFMESEGCKVKLIELVGEQLIEALSTKAGEELDELERVIDGTKEQIMTELADLKEVVEAWIGATGGNHEEYDIDEILANMNYQMSVNEIIKDKEIDRRKLQDVQRDKKEKKGGFEKGYYIEEVKVPKKNEWFQYLTDNYEEKK